MTTLTHSLPPPVNVQGGREPNLGRLSVVDVNVFVPPPLKSKRSGLYSRLLSSGVLLAGAVVKGKPSFVPSPMPGEPTAILFQSDHLPPGHWTINPQGLKQIGVNEKNIPRPFLFCFGSCFSKDWPCMHTCLSNASA